MCLGVLTFGSCSDANGNYDLEDISQFASSDIEVKSIQLIGALGTCLKSSCDIVTSCDITES